MKNEEKRLIFIDPSICDCRGHYLEYALSVLNQATIEGLKCILATNCKFKDKLDSIDVKPVFKYTFWEIFGKNPYIPDFGSYCSMSKSSVLKRILKYFVQEIRVKRYKINLKCFLKKIRLNENDIIFFPTVCHLELLAMAETINKIQISYAGIHVLFRRPLYNSKNWAEERKNPFVRDIYNKLMKTKKIKLDKLYFYTDTEELAKQYNSLDVYKFTVLPIPHSKTNRHLRIQNTIKIGYLGGARTEKGFCVLPYIVESLSGKSVEFYIQTNLDEESDEVKSGVSKLKHFCEIYSNICLLEELSVDEYERYIEQIDILLVLYDSVAYSARSSGIFVEAITGGCIVLTMHDTWMAAQVEMFENKYGLKIGEICHGEEDAVPMLEMIIDNIQVYEANIKEASSIYQRIHNPHNLLKIVQHA